jgi:hypothetical protein
MSQCMVSVHTEAGGESQMYSMTPEEMHTVTGRVVALKPR